MPITEITGQRNTNGGAASTSIIFTYPSTPTQGNLLVAGMSWRGNVVTVVPSGWLLAVERVVETNIRSAIYYKIAGATEPTGHTWTIGGSFKSAGCATEYSGIAASPLDKTNGNGAGTGTAGTTGATGTLTEAEELVIAVFSNNSNATWSAHDNGLAEIQEATSTGGPTGSRNTTSLASKISTVTTSVDYGATLSGSNEWNGLVATFLGGGTVYYLPSSGAAAASPAFAAWDNTASADRVRMVTTKTSSAMTEKTVTDEAVQGRRYLWRQFVSDPIAAQTIVGTVRGRVRVAEDGLDDNHDQVTVVMKVVSGDGSTLRGTLLTLAGNPYGNTNEYSLYTTLTTRSIANNAVLTSVDAQSGDRIVVEIGTTPSTAPTSLDSPIRSVFGDDASSFLAEDETGTAANNPWVQFSQIIAPGPANTQQTQQGTSRITASTIKTQDGTADILRTTQQTQNGVASLVMTATQDQGGTARITAAVGQDQDGVARVGIVTTQDQAGTARITASTPRDQDGIAKIVTGAATLSTDQWGVVFGGATPQTQAGVSRITAVATQAQSGVARVGLVTAQDQAGTARVGIVTPQAQAGVARITASTPRAQSGIANILVTGTTPQAQVGVSRITATAPQAQAGVARVAVVTGQAQGGTARVTATAPQTQAGTARVTASTPQTQAGVANILVVGTTAQTQAGIASILRSTPQAQAGVARVGLVTGWPQTGTARVTASAPHDQTGTARVAATTSQTQSGVARVGIVAVQVQSGVSRIAASTAQAQSGTARIGIVTAQDQSGVAFVLVEGVAQKAQSGVARIAKTVGQSLSGRAWIAGFHQGSVRDLLGPFTWAAMLDAWHYATGERRRRP